MNSQEVREMWMATLIVDDYHPGPSPYIIEKVKVHKKGEPNEHPKLWWTERDWPVYEGYQVFEDKEEIKNKLLDDLKDQKDHIERLIEHTKKL